MYRRSAEWYYDTGFITKKKNKLLYLELLVVLEIHNQHGNIIILNIGKHL